MKYLKYFKLNEMYVNKHIGRYLELETLDSGDLKITLTPEGKEEADDIDLNIFNFSDLFDDIRSNSELYYVEDLSDYGLAMSESPAITDGYYYDDNGNFTDDDNIETSQIFWYPNYMIKDFTKELIENGYVIFTTTKPRTPEEIEEIKVNRNVNKYGL